MTQASGRGSASRTASAPLPVHSSSITAARLSVAAGCSPARREGGDRAHDRGEPGLHVGSAASEQAPVADRRLEWRRGPERFGAGRHHVDMALQQQRASLSRVRTVDGGDAVAALHSRAAAATSRRPRRAAPARSAPRTATGRGRRTRPASPQWRPARGRAGCARAPAGPAAPPSLPAARRPRRGSPFRVPCPSPCPLDVIGDW